MCIYGADFGSIYKAFECTLGHLGDAAGLPFRVHCRLKTTQQMESKSSQKCASYFDTVRKVKMMELKRLFYDLTVCKVSDTSEINLSKDFYFIGKTDEEISLVCRTEDTPLVTTERDDGWKGFRIQGVLDFSLIGILAKLSGILAENKIGIFAVSTYNTDYILVKAENFDTALRVLEENGYTVV